MESSLSNQKNMEATIRSLETQVGQLAKQIADQQSNSSHFSANTHTNPKEHCKAITTRSGKVVGSHVGKNLQVEEEILREKERKKGELVVKESEEENNKSEDVNNEGENKEREKESESERRKKEKELKKDETPQLKSLPYPPNPSKRDKERQYARFLDIFKRLQINVPFMEAMEQMPVYAKFMKDFLTRKRKFPDETVELEAGCSAIIQKSMPQKTKDPGSFTILVTIGSIPVGKALLDLGASINLMPLSMLKKIGDLEIKPTRMTLQLADRSMKFPYGIAEDVLVKVDKFVFPVDFVVMEMEEDIEVPLILGRPFMKTAPVVIDVDDGKLKMRVQDDEINFNVFEAMHHPKEKQQCFRMDVIDELYRESLQSVRKSDALEKSLIQAYEVVNEEEEKEIERCLKELESTNPLPPPKEVKMEKLPKEEQLPESKVELKVLPSHLKYVFLESENEKPVIISSFLSPDEEKRLIQVLKANGAIGWTLSDLKGISPSYCMHKIHMEHDSKPVARPQRRLNPTMKEVVKKEVIKLLDASMIYPISDSV